MINFCLYRLKQFYYNSPLSAIPSAKNILLLNRVRTSFKKGTPEYQKFVDTVPEFRLRSREIKPFLKKHKIRDDAIIAEVKHADLGVCHGTNFKPFGDGVIAIYKGLYEIDKDAYMAVLKHEICHLKHSDSFVRPILASLGSLTIGLLGYLKTTSFLKTVLLLHASYDLLFAGITLQNERRADRFAMQESSVSELKGAWRELQAVQRVHGDRPCLLHPSVLERIQEVERALRQRGVDMKPTRQDEKRIQKIARLIHECSHAPSL